MNTLQQHKQDVATQSYIVSEKLGGEGEAIRLLDSSPAPRTHLIKMFPNKLY